jgi:putative transposase
LHGRRIGVRKTYLFAFIDDHSRVVPGYRWGQTPLQAPGLVA